VEAPGADCGTPGYDDSAWAVGRAGFGRHDTPSARVGTPWESSDIWLRRTFRLDAVPSGEVRLLIHHDEDAKVYLNGQLAADLSEYTQDYVLMPMAQGARNALRAGPNTIAVHCRQTALGQYIDCGLVVVADEG